MSEQQTLEQSEQAGTWEAHLHQLASAFPYPHTPDLAERVKHKLATRSSPLALRPQSIVRVAAVSVLILVMLMAIPPTRVKLLEILHMDGILILFAEPTPTMAAPTMTVTGLPTPTGALITATPQPSSTLLSSTTQNVAELTIYAPARPQSTRSSVSP